MLGDKVDIVKERKAARSDDAFDLIHTIMHLFRSQQHRAPHDGPHEMTHMEGRLISFFARHPGATLSNLVAYSGRDKGQLAKLIKSLKKQSLLRVREGEKKDRRSVGLALTPAGLSAHRTLRRRSGHLAKVAVRGLNAEERNQFLAFLQKVRTNLETIS